LPTNWGISNAGLTQTIVGVGTELGLPYVDIRLNGTASNAIFNLFTEGPTQVVASNGQTWTNSFYMKLVAAPNPYNLIQSNFSERTAAGSFLTGGQQTITLTSTLTRFTFTRTNTNALTERINAGYQGSLTIAATYDFTIRIAAPQMELGAYATTFIPTTTAAVTRIADAASKTGISFLIGQTEGTLFLDFIFKASDSSVGGQIAISDSGKLNRVILWNNFTFNTLALQLKANNVNAINNVSLGTFVDGTRYKIAIAYKSGNTAVYVNGTQTITNSSTFTFSSSLTDFILGSYETTLAGHQFCFKPAVFTTRLINSDLVSLTT
jgi:hypothetical protein